MFASLENMSQSDRNNNVPEFDGKNYSIWKIRMRVYLQSLGNKVWAQVLTRYETPKTKSTTSPDVMREKTLSEYTDTEHRQATFNAKVMNGIIHSMSNEEAYRVNSFNTAYDIW